MSFQAKAQMMAVITGCRVCSAVVKLDHSPLRQSSPAQDDQSPGRKQIPLIRPPNQPAAASPGRHLAGGGIGQCFAESQAFIKAVAINPATGVDDLVPKYGDVRLRSTKTEKSHPQTKASETDPGAVTELKQPSVVDV